MATTLAGIWELLRDEVANRIIDITPTLQEDADANFELYSDSADKTNEFEDKPGRARLFHIGDVDSRETWGFGNTTEDLVTYAPVMFWYPRTMRWNLAAQDDLVKIRDDLERNPTSVTNVAYRAIDRNAIQKTQDSSAEWDMYTLRLKAIIRVTHV